MWVKSAVLVFWPCCDKAPQTESLTPQKCIVIVWRLELRQSVGRAVFLQRSDPGEGCDTGLSPGSWWSLGCGSTPTPTPPALPRQSPCVNGCVQTSPL